MAIAPPPSDDPEVGIDKFVLVVAQITDPDGSITAVSDRDTDETGQVTFIRLGDRRASTPSR
jgi:hypothetical protein